MTINSAPKNTQPIGKDGFFVKVWSVWFDNNRRNVNLASAHEASDGTDHSDVVLNNAHRISSGIDHGFIDQDVTISSSPTFAGLTINGNTTITGDLTVDGKDMIKWAVLQG